jgi:hypothetical protein
MVSEPELKDELKNLERRAAQGQSMPDFLPAPAQLLYLSLRRLYADYAAGRITRENASAEKKAIYKQYRLYADMLEDTKRLRKTFCDRLDETLSDRRLFTLALAKGASAEELLPIACRIVRKVTGDESITWEMKA